MSAASLVDYLSEKLYSLSSKMWSDSLKPSSTSFLMNKSSQQYELSSMLAEVSDRSDYHVGINPSYESLSLIRSAAGIFSGLGLLRGLDQPNYLMNNNTKNFSPFLFNFVSDSHRSKHMPLDSTLFSPQNFFTTAAKESAALDESYMMSMKTETINRETVCDPEVTMSLDSSPLPPEEESKVAKEKCNVSRTMRLNIELVHRKTKEMSKRSKKRRRRQKKSEQLSVSNSASASDDDDDTNSVCFLSKSPDFGTTALSVTHVQLSPRNNFFIPATSNSEDDSEWEAFDEIELSLGNNVSSSKTDGYDFNSTPSSSCPIKCKNIKPNCSKSVDCCVQISSVISFVVPEYDSNDEDTDWDTCETDAFTENTDFELSELCFTDLCTPHSYYKNECFSDFTSEEDCEEMLQLRTILLEANNKWNKIEMENWKPKSASKVTFAPDEDLVEIFPVEEFERKGEWEIYATERLRFKRKIDQLEKVISPCLKPEHRSKIFKKFVEPKL